MRMPLFRLVILVLLLLLALIASMEAFGLTSAQEEKSLDAFGSLIGDWKGIGKGSSGTSSIDVSIEPVLDGKYIRVRTRSVFEPQEANPSGEVHEDVGYISVDKERGKYVFRQFHVEGFVNRYVMEETDQSPRQFEFVTESVENGPPGLEAKVVFSLVDEGELKTYFYLSFGGKDFTCMLTNELKRVRSDGMTMDKVVANLMVEDVNASVEFYRDVLGFEIEMSVPEKGKLDWAMVVNGGAELMFQARASIEEEYPAFAGAQTGGSLVLYVNVADVNALHDKVKGKARMTVDLHKTFYGATEFTIEDPDGFVLTFAQHDDE